MVKRYKTQRRTRDARRIWIKVNGPIPHDEKGFRYEVHHKDGNPHNNAIENLECIPIQEHLKKHLVRGDYGAAAMIARRMKLGPKYMSNIQRGCKRPGIGGAPKGTIPWNKGKKSCFSRETIESWKRKRKGKIYHRKITKTQLKEIIDCYDRVSLKSLPEYKPNYPNGKSNVSGGLEDME